MSCVASCMDNAVTIFITAFANVILHKFTIYSGPKHHRIEKNCVRISIRDIEHYSDWDDFTGLTVQVQFYQVLHSVACAVVELF